MKVLGGIQDGCLVKKCVVSAALLLCATCLNANSSHAQELALNDVRAGLYTQEESDAADALPASDQEMEKPRRSIASRILLYLPNRVFDLFDIVRIRARVGPGIAIGARVTKYVSAYVGSYGSIYAGLPGPRLRTTPRSPIGLETNTGITLSVLDATVDGGFGPNYSPTEIGAGLQLAIVGVDIGIDPVEILDFIAGFLTLDIRDDDF